jgi:hypothetical protein
MVQIELEAIQQGEVSPCCIFFHVSSKPRLNNSTSPAFVIEYPLLVTVTSDG